MLELKKKTELRDFKDTKELMYMNLNISNTQA